MQKITLQETLQDILRQDPRYAANAYVFIKESLDYTIQMLEKPSEGAARHVTASELLEGIRRYAVEEYGPMTLTVLESWGLKSSQDIGNVVFNLVKQGILGKTDNDHIADFAGGYDFYEVFRRPFLPAQSAAESGSPPEKPVASLPIAPRNPAQDN